MASLAPPRVFALTAATLLCFSANSLLTRAGLGAGLVDWASFVLIRLVSGAVMLELIVRVSRPRAARAGSWTGAAALAAYGLTFTASYTRLGAAVGALLLFGAVQVTMIGTGIARGERPSTLDWVGMLLAASGLWLLTAPGLTRPDPAGALLMIAAGVSWGVYSLLGRGGADPIAVTAGNFWRAAVLAAPLAMPWLLDPHLTTEGLWLATASGALASGVGYSVWYTVLPSLAAWRAALAQLLVPVLTAALAAWWLSEALSWRLVWASGLVLGGVAVTVVKRARLR